MNQNENSIYETKTFDNLKNLKFFIKTYGCQTNVYDSEKIALLLERQGMTEVSVPEEADVLLVNTCHIREKAKHKLYTELGTFTPLKQQRTREGRPLLIAVGGCVAQAEGETVFTAAPYVDVVFGPKNYHLVPELLAQALTFWKAKTAEAPVSSAKEEVAPQNRVKVPSAHLVSIKQPEESKFLFLPKETRSKAAAFLAIQEGCDKFCSYCVVPYTRGAEISRPAEAILEEAETLVRQGVVEITVLGQNVNAYHGAAPEPHSKWAQKEKEGKVPSEALATAATLRSALGPFPRGAEGGESPLEATPGARWTFSQLLHTLGQIEGLKRIFYTSSHPLDVSEAQLRAHVEIPAMMPFFQLPVQSGSTRILKAMNRRHTTEDYKRIIDSIRTLVPDIALCSDFIVGFPGETEEDFEETLEMVRYVRYAQAYSFKYSPRPGTVAAGRFDQIDETVKTRRLLALQALLGEQQKAFNQACIGRTVSVLFQRYGKKPGQILGKSEYMQSVVVDVTEPEKHINSLRPVRVLEATQSCLTGVFVD